MPEYVIAVDAGGTELSVAAIDAEGRIAGRRKYPVEEPDFERSIGQIVGAAYEVAMEADGEIAGMGVIVPGIYSHDTGRARAPDLWGPEDVPVLDALRAHISLPVAVDSDRMGYLLGECWQGVARGLKDVVFLAVGNGLGAGILSGGRLIRGAAGIAGAVGWLALSPERRDSYAQCGGWEAEASGPALARRAGMATPEEVAAAARSGDPRAIAAVRDVAGWLAMGIANLVSVLNPEMVVLGGRLMRAADLFLDPVRAAVPEWAQPLAARRVRIEATALGDDAGLLGAARLALGNDL